MSTRPARPRGGDDNLATGPATIAAVGRKLTLEEACEREIGEVHRFFVDWFTGVVPRTPLNFARIADVLADSFYIVSPRGVLTERSALLTELESAHGLHGDAARGFAIEVNHLRLRRIADGVCLARYEEWQRLGEVRTGRLASALLRQRFGPPNGIEWLAIHETWLPRGAPSR